MEVKVICTLSVCLLQASIFAGNGVFNSSLELGEKGWSGVGKLHFAEGHRYPDYRGSGWSVDATVAHTGRRSLRLEMPKGDYDFVKCLSHDVQTEKGRTYAVSFWAKASRPTSAFSAQSNAQHVDLTVGPRRDDHLTAHRFPLSTEWRRFEFAFDARLTDYSVQFGLEEPDVVVWVDDVQMEEGRKAGEYRPRTAVETAVYAEPWQLGRHETDVRVVSVAYDRDGTFEETVGARERIRGRDHGRKTVRFDLKKGEAAERTVRFTGLPYGWYQFHTAENPPLTPKEFAWDRLAQLERTGTSDIYLKVARGDFSYATSAAVAMLPPACKATDGFQLGPNVNPPNYQGFYFSDVRGFPADLAKTVKACGANFIKLWTPSIWENTEPEKGRYEWRIIDEQVDAFAKAGIRLLLTVTNCRLEDRRELAPWLLEKSTSHVWSERKNRTVVKPPLDEARIWWEALARHLKGRVWGYEIFNEPNYVMTPDEYAAWLKTAYEGIRAGDPGAKVVGICGTSDYNASIEGWVSECVNRGCAQWMDALSIHPYFAIDDELVSRFRVSFGKYSKAAGGTGGMLLSTEDFYQSVTRFLQTEARWERYGKYVVDNSCPGTLCWYWEGSEYPRKSIIALGEGVACSSTILFGSMLTAQYNPGQIPLNYSFGRETPNFRAVIAAATTTLLGGAVPLTRVEMPGGTMHYTWRNFGHVWSGLWNSMKEGVARFTVPKDLRGSIRVYDMLMNEREARPDANGRLEIPLGEEPVYVDWGTADESVALAVAKGAVCEVPEDEKRSSVGLGLNGRLHVFFDKADGSLSVGDTRTGRFWKSRPDGVERLSVRDVRQIGKNALTFRFGTAVAPGEFRGRVSVTNERVVVEIDADPALKMASRWVSSPEAICYPYPFISEKGDRLLLPNGSGYSFPVEMKNLGKRYAEKAGFCSRELRMGVWGHYRERTRGGIGDADAEVVPADGYMAVVETPCNALGFNLVRSNGLRAFNVGWYEDKQVFGHARRIHFDFLTDAGPVEIARRYREIMKEKGYLRTFAEKKRRHPEMAANYDRIMRSPSVWYWAINGEKAKVTRELREKCGFGDFLFQFASRKDLGTWVTPGEVKACAEAAPGVLLAEYDIYKDTMEKKYLSLIDYVRPYWSTDAADNDDIVIDWDGTVARGWAVSLKKPVDGKSEIGCAVICEQMAPKYARKRLAAELAKTPDYNARYLDVTGHALGECYHARHAHNRRESIAYRKALLGLVADEFHLLCSSEDGIECFVPECDYFTCGFSGPDYFRVDGGRWMWRIYDEPPPEHVMIGLDPSLKVPFWEMVFHDCTVCYWDWCDYNHKWPSVWWMKDLWNAVSGTPPLYFFNEASWARFKDRLGESYRRATSTAIAVAGERMTAYRYLTRDHRVQRSEWSNGVSCTVNFGETAYRMDDGYVLEAHGYRLERNGSAVLR